MRSSYFVWYRYMGLQGGIISNQTDVIQLGVRAGLAPITHECDFDDPNDMADVVAGTLGKVSYLY